ncbi:MAG: galactokinase [Planctomycetota bacterium]|jgi:galactokinase|nr:galactokinase [Planctomycetota bacterium]
MSTPAEMSARFASGEFNRVLTRLYNLPDRELGGQIDRYRNALGQFSRHFGEHPDIHVFSAPGRSEIGGNHTDHQNGRVLACGVNLDIIAVAGAVPGRPARLKSDDLPLVSLGLEDCRPDVSERFQVQALIRGIAAKFRERGREVGGFDCFAASNVLVGSGLSSSAAFEVLIGNIVNGLFCRGEASPLDIAKFGQFAENVHYGKPCGLMDQIASSLGGVSYIDFGAGADPRIEKIEVDFSVRGHALCIVDSGADHAGLSDEYAAIPAEMRAVAEHFGRERLGEVAFGQFLDGLAGLKADSGIGDRAILRALHFFRENARVEREAEALKNGDFALFLRLAGESGRSSSVYLQNIQPAGAVKHQEVGLALALCEQLLEGSGACRVHGGGFAGTVQSFVPFSLLERFRRGIEAVLGAGSCHILSPRAVGGIMLA